MISPPVHTAMLMAAGLGTRLRPFTDFRTKALMPVLGVPIAQFAIDSLKSSGVDRIVANIHHHAESTRSGLMQLERGNSTLIISDESSELLGSAGGMRKALPELGNEPFFLANADVLCDVDWSGLAYHHMRLREKWGVTITLTLFPKGPFGAKYREIQFDSHSQLITSLGTLQEGRPFFVGAAVLEPEALKNVPTGGPSEFLPYILEPAIREKRAGVYCSDGLWFDIGAPNLWLNTHIELMKLFETKAPPKVSHWNKRILKTSSRVADQIWISHSNRIPLRRSNWVGPCYWQGNTLNETAPLTLGPNAVLYGSIEGKNHFERGIGFRNRWIGS